jgi:nucleotide-binding universal stress UspA family protein
MTVAPFHRVLVGWDGSRDAAEALRIAASVVSSDGGRITALAVLPQSVRLEAADEEEAEHAALRHRVEDEFQQAWQKAPVTIGARASLEFVENDKAGNTVCAYAEEHGFDLLVLGRHGTGGILRPRLGHVAQTAARDSAIPVLLVNRPEAALTSLARRDRFASQRSPLSLARGWWAGRRRRPARR